MWNVHRWSRIALIVALIAGSSAAVEAAPEASPTAGASPGEASPAAAASAEATPAAPATFATPDEAITHYVAGVADQDFAQVLEASPVDQMASGYRFDLAAERLGAFAFVTMFAPGNDPFYQSINRSLQQGLLGRTVLFLSYSLLSTETIDGSVIAPVDEARAEQFVSQVDPTRLSGLSVVEIRFPNAKLENDPKLLSNYAADAKVWSADEETERAALISLDGKDYVIGFTLLRYGDSWGVARQSSGLLGTSVIGVATPTTPSDFDALTSGG